MRIQVRLICAAIIVALAIAGCSGKSITTPKAEQPAPRKTTAAPKTGDKKTVEAKPEKRKPADPPANPATPDLGGILGTVNPNAGQPAPPPIASLAQPKSPAVGAKPAVEPSRRPTAEQLLSAMRAVYGTAKQVKIEGVTTTVVKQDGKVAAQAKDQKMVMLFKRPDRFKMSGAEGSMTSDGKNVYMYDSRTKRYAKDKMDKQVLQGLVMSKPGVGVMGLLLGVDYAPMFSSMRLLKDSKVGGKDVYVLSLQLKKPKSVPGDVQTSQTLYVGKSDLVVYRNQIVSRVKPQVPKGYEGKVPKLVESTMSSTINKLDPDPGLKDSDFAFRPPSGARLYQPPKPPEPVDLSEKAAPDFSFKWTDGTDKKLSDFRGKVVVLVYWALPDSEKQLPVLQKVYEQNDPDVQMVTVNLNRKDAETDKFVKDKGLTFPVVHANESIAEVAMRKYGLMAVPTLYVVDRQGTVKRTVVGDLKLDDITAKIKKIEAQ